MQGDGALYASARDGAPAPAKEAKPQTDTHRGPATSLSWPQLLQGAVSVGTAGHGTAHSSSLHASAGAVGASQPLGCCSSWSANTWAAQQSSHTPEQPLHESTGILLLQAQPGLVSLLHSHRPLQTGWVFSKNHPDLGPLCPPEPVATAG